jgi:hypothetical protein
MATNPRHRKELTRSVYPQRGVQSSVFISIGSDGGVVVSASAVTKPTPHRANSMKKNRRTLLTVVNHHTLTAQKVRIVAGRTKRAR